MEVNSENIEMWIMMLVDDELSQEETQIVWDYIAQHPEYMDMYTAFMDVKVPSEVIACPDITTLFKTEDTSVQVLPVRRKTMVFRYAGRVAAAIVLLTGLGWYGFYREADAPVSKPIAATIPSGSVNTGHSGLPHSEEHSSEQVTARPDDNPNKKQVTVVLLNKKQNVIDASGKQPVGGTITDITSEELSRIRPVMPKGVSETEQLIVSEMNMLPVNTPADETQERPGRNILPVAATIEQKVLLDDISRDIQEKMDIIKDAYQVVKNSTVQINFGNRSFTIKK